MPNDSGDRGGDRNRWPGFDLGGSGSGGNNRNRWRYPLIYAVIGIFLLFLLRGAFEPQPSTVPLNTFFGHLRDNRIAEVTITSDSIEWKEKDDTLRRATLPTNYETTQLVQDLADKGIELNAEQPSALTGFLLQWLLPLLFLAGIWFFLIRRMAGGGAAGALNLGRKGVKIFDRKDMKTTFGDVAGLDEAVEELREIVDFLTTPKKYQRLGGRIPKGVLLLGPPGCGKTLLARAVAGEAQVPFFFMSGSEFVEMFVGLGAARVRELFNQAKEKAPCLVFLDELDTIGKSRAGALGGSLGSHDEREQTLNQLLVEMDGFDTSKGVIIMAATNRADVLDPALLRPGRFDRQVVVDRPDLRGREAILRVHSRGVALDKSVELRTLAARTPGFTGADLANVVNEAALLAARREKNSVMMEELEEAIDRVIAGLERKSRVLSDKEKARVATHEMGHALVGLRLKNIDPVHRVTIIPRGLGALGITMTRPLEDRYLMTEPELLDRLAFALGGRTAEEIIFKEISTGAADDLQKATEIARAMVMEYGMSPKLGPLSFAQNGFRNPGGGFLFPGDRPEMSEETQRTIDEEATRLMNEAHERARVILTRDKPLLEQLSKVLMEREVIDGKELRAFLDGETPIPSADDLRLEAEQKAADNGHREGEEVKPGPAIRPSITPESAQQTQTEEIPTRPDHR